MGSFGTVHVIGNYPRLTVKEIRLDDQNEKLTEVTGSHWPPFPDADT